MFILAIGTVVGYGSGFAHLAHNRWARMHGYQGDCGSWKGGNWDSDGYGAQWNRPPAPPVQQQQAPVVQQQPAPQPQVIIVQQPAATPPPQAQTPVIVVQPQALPQQIVLPQNPASGSSEQTR